MPGVVQKFDRSLSSGLNYLMLNGTTSALLVGAQIASAPMPSQIVNPLRYHANAKEWERELGGENSSGSKVADFVDFRNFQTIASFAKNLLSEMVDVPEEYDRIFQQNIGDILA